MPKERQKKLLKKIVELKKNRHRKNLPPFGQLMREVGYAVNYSTQPSSLRKTKSWQNLLDIYLPQEKVAKVHRELLDSAEIQHLSFPFSGKGKNRTVASDDEIKKIIQSVNGCKLVYIKHDDYSGSIAFFQAPDGKVRKDAVDMAYKLRGAYTPEEIELTRRKYQDLSDAELEELEEKMLKHFAKK